MLMRAFCRCEADAQQRWQWEGPDGCLEGMCPKSYLHCRFRVIHFCHIFALVQQYCRCSCLFYVRLHCDLLQSGKISEEYEKRGGGYENEPGSKNEPTKGAPKSKSDEKKDAEMKEQEGAAADDKEEEKPKANSGKKATGKKETKTKAPKKEKKPPTEGTRRSTRTAGKRSAPEPEEDEDDEEEEEEKKPKKKAPAKKAKTAKK